VILTRTGAKLLDFNIASRVGDPGAYSFRHAALSGTRRRPGSLGCLHGSVRRRRALCDGHHPYPNAMPMIDLPVIDPRTIRPDLGPYLASFLLKACAPVSADRFATAAEMRLALSDIRAHL
jgi:hypothetical protein